MRRIHPRLCQVAVGAFLSCAFVSAAGAAEPVVLTDDVLEITTSVEHMHSAIGLTIDFARILRLERSAGTVIIGNPGIANATLADDQTVVLTGKAAGATNMIILDEDGTEISNVLLRVGTSARPHVIIYNGLQRHTYSCAPNCEPVIAVGDADPYFQSVLTQTQARQAFSGTAGP